MGTKILSKKILVVEDHKDSLELVTLLLTGVGHTVLQATNAVDGIAVADREQPDLILMDIQLPEVNGLEALHTLKEDSSTERIKVVALTAFTMIGDREKMLAAGFDGYIPKPIIDTKEFLATVSSFL